ncbi:hypothetical protein AAEO56_07870 [Flavobacterium sp. DGU11]|uniref:Tetratricopeptide repeat-containing protein n=1 Tax=Flavobacterium arundinis TaxID=3139143 RepID=A0ABU9HVI4_9FLAO
MEDYQNRIRQLKDEALVEYKAGSIDKAIILTIRSWDALPEPKYEKPDSYLIARSMVFLLNKAERYDEALVWAQHLMQSSPDRYDSGDREFMAGTVLYHIGRKDDAWMYFDVANDKSESRCFESTDTIYREFFESRDGKILKQKKHIMAASIIAYIPDLPEDRSDLFERIVDNEEFEKI